MNQDVPPASLVPRRCGTCHHAMRTGVLDGSVVACMLRLEYQCADRVPDCAQYHPAVCPGESAIDAS